MSPPDAKRRPGQKGGAVVIAEGGTGIYATTPEDPFWAIIAALLEPVHARAAAASAAMTARALAALCSEYGRAA